MNRRTMLHAGTATASRRDGLYGRSFPGSVGKTVLLLAACWTWIAAPALAQFAPVPSFAGTLFWSAPLQGRIEPDGVQVGLPEISTRLELAYERPAPDFLVRLRADARGIWGARPGFNSEAELSHTISIREASVTALNRWGEWTIGRQPMLLPFMPGDYRRFGLLVGNASAPADGVAWYRPLGKWELEAAIAYIHVLRNPATGLLERGDVWAAARASGGVDGTGWQLAYAPTLVLSDAVDSWGASLPLRLDIGAHRLEGEVGDCLLPGTPLVPTGWDGAWIVRYQPLRPLSLPVASIEAANIHPYFLPHMANFADRGGGLNWQPGERGVIVGLSAGSGRIDLGWREIQRRSPDGGLVPSDVWELTWTPGQLPRPFSSGSLGLAYVDKGFAFHVRAAVGYRF